MSSPSFASVTPGNMELTPVRVTYKGVDLGGTLGNVSVKLKYGKSDIMADQFGKSVLDRVVSSVEATIETELTEIDNPDIWKVVFPNAIKTTSGGNHSIIWESKIGQHDLDLAGELILHPLSHQDSDLSGDMTAPLALASEESSIVYGPTEQARLKIVWNVYLDTGTQPAVLFKRGDPAIGITAASAGSPGFTGTGNGTMTNVVVGPDTLTETITATCVGIPASNQSNWYVSGSLSGALGILELTGGAGGHADFTSDPISFRITDGTTDFVVGDAFTVATTAPNYV